VGGARLRRADAASATIDRNVSPRVAVSSRFDRKAAACCKARRANYYREKLLERIAMAANLSLGNLEEVINRLVASGRYGSKIEVIREGVRLVEERERRLAALDAAIERGIADAEAGRVTPADVVFDRLTAKYQNKVESKRR
jgi:antitoxin ParD1/3/4